MMHWLSGLPERAAESNKAVAAVSAFSSFAGVASFAQWLTGIAAGAAVFAGLACTLVLMRLNWIKGENEKVRGQMLRERAAELGIFLNDED